VPELGSAYLLAQEYVNRGLSSALPNNQWIIEFKNFFEIMLAQMQQSLVEYVAGPNDPIFDKYVQPPPANQSWMCSAQIVSRSGYLSFSVFPFALILIIGVCVIFLNPFIEGLLGFAKNRFVKFGPSPEWKVDSLLQLQRMAFRDSGKLEWSNSRAAVPVCGSEKFVFSDEEEAFLLFDETGSSIQRGGESTIDTISPIDTIEREGTLVNSAIE
jgi:hypothetical protein